MPRVYTPPLGNTQLSVGDTLGEAWQVLTTNYGMLLGASLLTFILPFLAALVGAFIPIVGGFVSYFVQFPLMCGMVLLSVHLARGPQPTFDTLFLGFKRYWPAMGVGALKVVAMILPAVIYIIGGAGLAGCIIALNTSSANPALLIGGIVLSSMVLCAGILVSTFVFLRLVLADGLVIDTQADLPGPVDAIKASWMLTRPVIWPLVGIALCMLGISLLCTIALILPVIFIAAPYWYAVIGVIYTRIVGELDPLTCRQCAYDLRGTTAPVCPECGMARPA